MQILKTVFPLILMMTLMCLTGCNDDDPKFSPAQIRAALSEMEGTYDGEMRVSCYHGETVSESNECTVFSKDSLTIHMDLALMASTIADDEIASLLRNMGVVRVKAAYEFYQIDDTMYFFVLHPDDMIDLGGFGAPPSVRIVFSQIFGGWAEYHYRDIAFNLSPIELWVGGEKYEPFRQLVYHFEGQMRV